MFDLNKAMNEAVKSVQAVLGIKTSTTAKPAPTPTKPTAPKALQPLAPLPKINWQIAPKMEVGKPYVYDWAAAARSNAEQVANSKRVSDSNSGILSENARKLVIHQAALLDLGKKVAANKITREKALQEIRDKLDYKDLSEFDRMKQQAKDRAILDSKSQEKSKGFLDDLTGGFTGENRARGYAQQKQANLQADITDYEERLKTHNSDLAKREQYLKNLSVNGTQEQFEKAVTEAQAWLDQSLKKLNSQAAYIQGASEGYGEFADSELTSYPAKIGQFFDPKNNPVTGAMANIFKYTLGQGDENVPSVVTAPSRAINWFGNISGANSQVNKFDGTKEPTSKDWGQAWKQTQEQRNFNIGNSSNTFDVDKVKESDYQDALKLYKQKKQPNDLVVWYKDKLPTKEEWLNEIMYDYSTGTRVKSGTSRDQFYYRGKGLEDKKLTADVASNTLEFMADPLFLFGTPAKGGRIASMISKGVNKVSDVVKNNKFVTKVAESKVGQGVGWLGKEKQTPKEKYSEMAQEYEKRLTQNQSKYLPAIAKLRDKIQNNKVDYSVFEDLGKLTDDEAAILQRMTGLNSFAMRDKVRLFSTANGRIKAKQLLDIHKRAQANAAFMKKSDAVTSERFTGRYYSQGWLQGPKDKKYNFRAFRKNSNIQSASQLKASQVERYFQSAVDDVGAVGDKPRKSVTKAQADIKKLLSEYDSVKLKDRKGLDEAYSKTRTVGDWLRSRVGAWRNTNKMKKFHESLIKNPVKTSISTVDPAKVAKGASAPKEKLTAQMWANSGAKALGVPIQVWKTAVLALRPAWYVNNKIYNISAGLNSAGLGYLPESIKMLRKGELTKARNESPEVISKIGKYLDNGNPLWKPASALEDADRLAAYRALIRNGATKEEALKRVDKYFFKYTTKNWERPLKTFMPFWAWSKGTAGAAIRMPTDRPLSAKIINTNEKNNEKELRKIPEEKRKYYEGRQFLGNDKDGNLQWAGAPFNPFTKGTFDSVSANPFISALAELSTQKDYYGNPLKDKSIRSAFLNKFPQVPLAKQVLEVWKQNNGDIDATLKYFSKVGSDGYAMTKERQGNDKSKTNYAEDLDPSAKFGENFLAFLGVPRGSKFDREKYDKAKALTDLNAEFFKHDWKKEYPDYNERIKAQEDLAKSSGFDLQKDLYKGYWTKNDSDLTKELKAKKDEARTYLNKFWTEYHNLPQDGNRNVWVKNKMKDIVDSKIILSNPFIADGLPDWFDPNSRQKAFAKEFWNKYWSTSVDGRRKLIADNPQYAKSRGTSQKALDYKTAKSSGNWADYVKKHGTSANSEAAKFWTNYFQSSNAKRKELLKENPKYNKFASEVPKTQAEWDLIMDKVKSDRKARALTNKDFAAFFALRKAQALTDKAGADRRASVNYRKIAFKK